MFGTYNSLDLIKMQLDDTQVVVVLVVVAVAAVIVLDFIIIIQNLIREDCFMCEKCVSHWC